MSAFTKSVRTLLEQASREAERERSSKIEAQHVLLAMCTQADTPAARILSSVGLDHGALSAALEREYTHSLRVAGVSLAAFDLSPNEAHGSTAGAAPVTVLGTSVRSALERGVSGVRRNPRAEHLLLGILGAEYGTVPRALALAGIDREALLLRVREMLLESAA